MTAKVSAKIGLIQATIQHEVQRIEGLIDVDHNPLIARGRAERLSALKWTMSKVAEIDENFS